MAQSSLKDSTVSPMPIPEMKYEPVQGAQLKSRKRWRARISVAQKVVFGLCYIFLALTALYVFMVAIKLIGKGFTLALGCESKGSFDFANNPIAGLMLGSITTASSTVTSIIVARVGSGGMTIRQGVYVVMGANIGTCVTCIMVAFGQVGDPASFQRAMAAASVHDMYDIWSVIVMSSLEISAHPLKRLSVSTSNTKTSGGNFKSPVDILVNPRARRAC